MSYVRSYNISMTVEGLYICTKRDAHVRGLQYGSIPKIDF